MSYSYLDLINDGIAKNDVIIQRLTIVTYTLRTLGVLTKAQTEDYGMFQEALKGHKQWNRQLVSMRRDLNEITAMNDLSA